MRFLSIFFIATALLITPGCGRSRSEQDPNENVLYANLPTKVKGLDPGDISDVYSALVAAQCYECLYQYHYLKRPYEIIPQLADGMPQPSDDGLACTIKIKKGRTLRL